MSTEVTTSNLAEALYLFQRGGAVASVHMASIWPAILLEGETAQEDHLRYVAHKVEVDLRELPKLFAAIAAVLQKGGAS